MLKVMFSLPDQLVSRMKSSIPARERSKVLVNLLEKEIAHREKNLFLRAQALEASEGLEDEMTTWDKELGEDGLKNV